jgi:hypothetical protein
MSNAGAERRPHSKRQRQAQWVMRLLCRPCSARALEAAVLLLTSPRPALLTSPSRPTPGAPPCARAPLGQR